MARKSIVDDELAKAIASMRPRQQLYELIKAEMQRRGRWKVSRRGKPFERGTDPRRPKNGQ